MSDESWSEDSSDKSWDFNSQVQNVKEGLPYEVLDKSEISSKQLLLIQELSENYLIDQALSQSLLIKYNWNLEQVIESLADSSETIPNFTSDNTENSNLNCMICFNLISEQDKLLLLCNHIFCSSCFTSYLSESLNQGPSVLQTNCPYPACKSPVSSSLFKSLLSPLQYQKYSTFLLLSYSSSPAQVLNPINPTKPQPPIKFCPSSLCQNAILLNNPSYSSEVTCTCGFTWCFKCTQESHRPLSCEMLNQWEKRVNNDGSDSWILANTKVCPKCKNYIEKNLGCMHMTCKCGHQFCWLCLGDWSEHGSNTGGYYSCNKFNEKREKGEFMQDELNRVKAGFEIRRFEHYYSRFLNHKASLKRAVYQCSIVRDRIERVEKRSGLAGLLDFALKAAELVFRAKKYLAFSYPVGFFLNSRKKISFYEFIQGELEHGVIMLEQMLDEDFEEFLVQQNETCTMSQSFNQYRNKVNDLKENVQNYFDQCLLQMEAGFPEIESGGPEDEINSISSESESTNWVCSACTLPNNSSNLTCSACNSSRLRLK